MSSVELQSNPAHIEMLDLMGEHAGNKSGLLYYPGCSNDESPEHTRYYENSTIYVDMYDEVSIELHRALGRRAFVADATEFRPDEQPDAIAFFNPSGILTAETIIKSGLRSGGYVGLASWDQHKITAHTYGDVPGLEIKAVIVDGTIDENVKDYGEIEDDDLLKAVYPERYTELVTELHRIGVDDQDINTYGVIDMVRWLEAKAHQEMVDSGYSKGYWMSAYNVDIPSKKDIGYGFVIAQVN